MNSIKYLACLTLILVLLSCHQNEADNLTLKNSRPDAGHYHIDGIRVSEESAAEMLESDSYDKEQSNQTTASQPTKIIRHGHMNFEVKALEKAKSNIDILISTFDGYYESEDFNSHEYQSAYNLKIRVPNQHFDTLVSQLENGQDKLTYKRINANDVTAEYVDLEIRQANSEAYLKRYNELLNKAQSIKDILEIQEKTRRIEAELEAQKGRLKYLSNQVNYSTLNLNLTERFAGPQSKDNFGHQIVRAVKAGGHSFLNFILIVIRLWPYWILLFILWLLKPKFVKLIKKIRS